MKLAAKFLIGCIVALVVLFLASGFGIAAYFLAALCILVVLAVLDPDKGGRRGF